MKTSIAGVSLVALTLMTPGASISAAPRADGGDAARAIVFVDGAGSASEIYVRSGDGTRQRVTQNRSQESFPAWSPDRRRIAFVRDGAIWVIGWSDGTPERRLTSGTGAAADLYPAWSPDGRFIAFASTRGRRESELYVMNADGTRVRRLTRTPRWVEDTQPRFSPDGRFIVFAANRPSFFNHEIYRIRAGDGGGLRRLTVWGSGQDGAPGDDLAPTYSPDGRTIAFTSDRSGDTALWTMSADGRSLREVARHAGGHVALPRFSADGRVLVYGVVRDEAGKPQTTRLWSVRTDGTERMELGPGREPDWGMPPSRPVAAPTLAITQRAIGGAALGRDRRSYERLLGPPRVDLLEGGIMALVYTRPGLTVFLRGNAGIAINGYGRPLRTAEGIGPCSRVRDLMAAYRGRLTRLPTTGPVSLYRLGNLVFRVDRARGRVGSVTLGRGPLARLVAGNSIDCRVNTRAVGSRPPVGRYAIVTGSVPGWLESVRPLGRGRWVSALPSQDGETLLAQWLGECEVPLAYFVDVRTRTARPAVQHRGGALVESIVVGWADDGRAQVFLPKGVCASGARRPGLYLVPIDGAPELSRSETVGPGP